LPTHLYHHHYVALDNIWGISIEGETKSIVRAKVTTKSKRGSGGGHDDQPSLGISFLFV
jgi:hypothetical protein